MLPQHLAAAPHELLTPRLSLELPCPGHAPAFAESLGLSLHDPRFIVWRRSADLAWALHFCDDDARSVAAGEDLVFHVFQRSDRAYVGRVDVHSVDFSACRGEIGYAGDVRRAGRGLMREAALTLMDWAYSRGMARIEVWCDVRNTRALAFAEGLGLQREGLMRKVERDARGQLCDQHLLARLVTDGVPTIVDSRDSVAAA